LINQSIFLLDYIFRLYFFSRTYHFRSYSYKWILYLPVLKVIHFPITSLLLKLFLDELRIACGSSPTKPNTIFEKYDGKKDLSKVKEIISQYPSLLNENFEKGDCDTPLIVASCSNAVSIVEFLLSCNGIEYYLSISLRNCVNFKLSISSIITIMKLSRFLVQNSRSVHQNSTRLTKNCSPYQIRPFTSTKLSFSKESNLNNFYPTVDDFHVPKSPAKKVNNEVSFSVDRTGMINYALVEANLEADEKYDPRTAPGKEVFTPLAEDIYSLIEIKGPISIHEYMSQTLNHSVHGYYQTGEIQEGKPAEINEKIGEKGDFITSPEISQLFGEMIGVWIYSSWQALGSPSSFDLIELGPGKGTLMKDILKVLKKLPSSCLSAVNIHFVELSSHLRQRQFNAIEEGGKFTTVAMPATVKEKAKRKPRKRQQALKLKMRKARSKRRRELEIKISFIFHLRILQLLYQFHGIHLLIKFHLKILVWLLDKNFLMLFLFINLYIQKKDGEKNLLILIVQCILHHRLLER
jgi:hypothetical protein